MFFRKYLSWLFERRPSQQARRFKGIYLPLARSNEGLSDDQEYVNSAVKQVEDLLQHTELTANTRILDFGYGQGRFSIGLLAHTPNIKS